MGPMVVIRRTKGGAYLVAEMNGAMFHDRIAAFRVILYEACYSIQLPANIQKFIDISVKTLQEMVDKDHPESDLSKVKKYKGKDLQFDKVQLRVTPEDFEEDETSESEAEEEEEPFGLDSEAEDTGRRSPNGFRTRPQCLHDDSSSKTRIIGQDHGIVKMK
jgi:hypothetical protein